MGVDLYPSLFIPISTYLFYNWKNKRDGKGKIVEKENYPLSTLLSLLIPIKHILITHIK